MKLAGIKPSKGVFSLLRYRPHRDSINSFKANLSTLIDKIKIIEQRPIDESEEHLKNDIRDFLRDTFYKETNAINTKDRKDLVIHKEKSTESKVALIIEAKRPSNKGEMMSLNKPNTKALHELVLYYLKERENGNIDINYLIATNINEWFIFDAKYFEQYFFDNKSFYNEFAEWSKNKKVTDKTKLFYDRIVKPYIDSITEEIPCIYFDIRDYKQFLTNEENVDNNLLYLYKLLSPYFLLKKEFADDSNELDQNFYKELLHIIGLEEVKDGGKLIIQRKEIKDAGSLLELVIDELKTNGINKVTNINTYGTKLEEQYFNIALELCITWVNRILFLKLLEGQLINFHRDKINYNFLNIDFIKDYDELSKLFHSVLAVPTHLRNETIQQKFKNVPYLNSSLFEISGLEDESIKINSLYSNAQPLNLFNSTILAEVKKKVNKLSTLQYLFLFLDAYDFSTDTKEDIKEDNKTLITASVLGKVFEKINGYKDGSIFTPSFITMYMCTSSIRLAVMKKFNDAYNWACKDFEELKEKMDSNYLVKENRLKYNELINSIKICDPAVGSGHFLVSALNELIAIKSDLNLLSYKDGSRVIEWKITIDNDELIITNRETEQLFSYSLNANNRGIAEVQKLQESLFYEKQIIIENCLFGVDINQKSVMICRLRLWIELLKNAYYKADTGYCELETLPNIDINIKCGNSLISRFSLDSDLSKVLKSIKYDIKAYRGFVNDYRNEKSRDVKRGLQKIIDNIKNDFKIEIYKSDPKIKQLNKLSGELFTLLNQTTIFENNGNQKKAQKETQQKLEYEISVLTKEIEEIKNNTNYKQAFEWRFEFPEVLNDKGEFLGFDVVIGNPPYGAEIPNRDILKQLFPKTSSGQIDTYKYFIELGFRIVKENGLATFITSDSYLGKKYFTDVRLLMNENSITIKNIKLGDNIFDGINLPTAIFQIQQGVNANIYEFKDISNIYNKLNKIIKLNKNLDYNTSVPDLQNSFFVKKTILKQSNCKKLIDIYEQVMGVKVYQIGKGKPKQTSIEYEDNAFIANKKLNKNYYKFISQGIERYKYKFQGEWINYGEWLAEPRKLKYFIKPKIVIREIVNPRIFATYIEEKAVVKNIAAVIIQKDEMFSLKYLLALLNSKLFTYYLFEQSPKSSNKSYPSFTSELIKNMPIKDISLEEQKPFIVIVNEIISQKQQGKDSTENEKKIDNMVYKLYELTDEEIRIVEGG